jgi:hypothetical protein
MLPGFTSGGAIISWARFCALPASDKVIMMEKPATRFFIMLTKRSVEKQ